ncbi:TRAP transporter small permease [Desulfocicer niacini]
MKMIQLISLFLNKLAGILLLGMMLLTCADVVGGVFNYPVLGAEELTALMAAVLLGFALPSAHRDKANVGVELLYLKFPAPMKWINDCMITLVGGVLFALITWQCFSYANELRISHEVSMTLQFPTYILVFCISFAMFMLTLVMAMELFYLAFKKESL